MSHPVCIVPKNSQEIIQFKLEEFKGRRLADMRVYYQQEGKDQVPTRKGISIPISLWPQFRVALGKLEQAIIAAGWLDAEDLEE